jgi:long-subunit fatty acid transport protein
MRFPKGVAVFAVGAACSGTAAPALATSVQEFPDNGSEQEARGGAWIARASDPLAAFYNPAGLAGQVTRLTLQSNVSFQRTCFTRVKAIGDGTADGVMPGAAYPRVCSDADPFPGPQLGATFRVTPRLGLGLLLLGPSAVGKSTWPEFVGTSPAPERYLLTQDTTLVLTPTIAAGWEVVDRLRIGASFQFGIAPTLDFVNASPAINSSRTTPATNDIRAELHSSSWFIPGFTLGTIWSPGDEVDVAGWYRWSAPIDAKGDVQTASNYYTPAVAANPSNTGGVTRGDTSSPNCGNPALASSRPCGSGDNAHLKVPIPMEAKIGVRYHRPRPGVRRDLHRRDPISDDAFDVEANFTWANDSAFDYLELSFPGDAQGNGTIPANPGIPQGKLPPNASVRHHYRDAFGVRLGGEVSLLPNRLSIRLGAFFETRSADPTYQNIDFDGAERVGVAGGGTYRFVIGSHALDVMVGYGHVFFGTLENKDPNAQGLVGLAGTACNPTSNVPGPTCPSGNLKYRTNWPVNLGTITRAIDVVNAGLAYSF